MKHSRMSLQDFERMASSRGLYDEYKKTPENSKQRERMKKNNPGQARKRGSKDGIQLHIKSHRFQYGYMCAGRDINCRGIND